MGQLHLPLYPPLCTKVAIARTSIWVISTDSKNSKRNRTTDLRGMQGLSQMRRNAHFALFTYYILLLFPSAVI